MADTGYRSIEVTVINNTQANLSVQAASTNGSNAQWISGEQPKPNQVLEQWQSVTWGVMTNDEDGSVLGTVSLLGYGKYPITINFANPYEGESSANVIGNDKLTGTTTDLGSGEDNAAQWQA